MKPLVVFIVGPTGIGKTSFSVKLARKMNGEIISADSMQIYKGMNIGTAKPSAIELRRVRHHLINIHPLGHEFSVYEFRCRALKAIADIIRRKKIPFVTGGTGLYIRSLLEGLSEQPGENKEIRNQLELEARERGLSALYERLKLIDPVRAEQIDARDQRRIIRALEIAKVSGKIPSAWHQERESLELFGYQPLVFGLDCERQKLYARIEKRVDAMMKKGWIREAKRLRNKKWSKTALQAVGYREIFQYLDGELTFSLLIERIKKNTRHLAKRQLTWFRRERGIIWLVDNERVNLAAAQKRITTYMKHAAQKC